MIWLIRANIRIGPYMISGIWKNMFHRKIEKKNLTSISLNLILEIIVVKPDRG